MTDMASGRKPAGWQGANHPTKHRGAARRLPAKGVMTMATYRRGDHNCESCRWRSFDTLPGQAFMICFHHPRPDGLDHRGRVAAGGSCEFWEKVYAATAGQEEP